MGAVKGLASLDSRPSTPFGTIVDVPVQSCNCAYVNVTIKLDSSLCKEARHRAIDQGLSLSGWIRELLDRELAEKPEKTRGTLLDMLGDKRAACVEFEVPRFSDKVSAADL